MSRQARHARLNLGFCFIAAGSWLVSACSEAEGERPGTTPPDAVVAPTATTPDTQTPSNEPSSTSPAVQPVPTAGAGGDPAQPTPDTGGAGGTPPANASGGGNTGGTSGAGGTSPNVPQPGAEGVLFAEDFEGDSALDPIVWEKSIVGGNESGISVDATQGHDSGASLKVSHTGFHTMAMLVDPDLFPLAENSAFVRVWMKIGSEIPSGHGTFIEAGLKMNDQHELRIGVNLNVIDVNYWPGDWEQRTEALNWTRDEWHCVEFQIDGSAHEMRVWYDDAALEELTVTDWTGMPGNHSQPESAWVPPIESIRFGGELQSAEVWFDDIVVSSSKIGCQ